MKLYLDTEFNGFDGELISIGIAPADYSAPYFYSVVKWSQPTQPWVQANVVPKLGDAPQPRAKVARDLAKYLRTMSAHGTPTLVADWPADFKHVLDLLMIEPGQMVSTVDFNMEFRQPNNPLARASEVPHHALSDAIALRNFYEGTLGKG